MKDARKVWEICQQMVDTSRPRMNNYANLNLLYNGNPPWTRDQAEADHQHTNVNWLEGTEKIQEARSQARNALKGSQNFFTVKIPFGDIHRRQSWGITITRQLNKILKRSNAYNRSIDNNVSQMIVLGIGPCTWMSLDDWCPRSRSLEDVLIPTGTLTSRENMEHFGVRITFTASDLIKQTTGDKVDKGWDQKVCGQCIDALIKRKPGDEQLPPQLNVVKIVEDFKENGVFYQSDKIPVLHCFDFYFLDNNTQKWRRQITIDTDASAGGFQTDFFKSKFLYDNPDIDYGDKTDHILHALIADGCVVAPARWHSVRSLGYMLYPMCMQQNIVRCKLVDATLESLLMLFRATSEGERELIQKVDLRQHGIIPNGLSWVLPGERNEINFPLVNGLLAMNRQLISENSSSFTQDVETGTNKEMTATETLARATSANKLQSAIMANLYEWQTPQYREILRRFCTTKHKDCQSFRQKCEMDGVPPQMWTMWDDMEVEPEKIMGGGDRLLQITIADKLMALAPRMVPQSQVKALHMSVEAVSQDPDLAADLVPLDQPQISPSVEKAAMSWATLIDAKPVPLGPEVNQIEYLETLLELLNIEFNRLEALGEVPDEKRIGGLINVVNTCKVLIQQIGMDQNQQDRVRGYAAAIGAAENNIKAYIQQNEQRQQAAGDAGDAETAGKIKAMETLANAKATIMVDAAGRKLEQKDIAFTKDQQRKDAKTAAEIAAQGARTQVELAGMSARQRLQEEAQINSSSE